MLRWIQSNVFYRLQIQGQRSDLDSDSDSDSDSEGSVKIVLGDLKLRRCQFREVFFFFFIFSLLKKSLSPGISTAMIELMQLNVSDVSFTKLVFHGSGFNPWLSPMYVGILLCDSFA